MKRPFTDMDKMLTIVIIRLTIKTYCFTLVHVISVISKLNQLYCIRRRLKWRQRA